jgi:hypothetical protein
VTEVATPADADAAGAPVSVVTGWKSVTLDNEGPGARSTISVT